MIEQMTNTGMDVSVILPVYNAERYVRAAIESVLTQEFSGSFEILVADDASTDSTPDIIRAYMLEYPSLIKAIFRKENIGGNPNSYELCMGATGRYLAFIDADDIWVAKDKLQRQIDLLEDNKIIGAVCSNSYYMDDKGVIAKSPSKDEFGIVPFEEMIRGHKDIFCSSFVCRTELYRKMAAECNWYIEKRCFNDTVWAFWLSYHKALFRMREPLSAYRVLRDSACRSTDKERARSLRKRYYDKKLYFLLTHDYPVADKMDIISQEYDKLYREAYFEGEMKVRNTRTFKAGRRIKEGMKIGKRIAHHKE